MLGLTLKIGIAVAALLVGVWLGMPGRYTQSVRDIDEVMDRGGGRRRTVKRRFTPLAWMQRQVSARSGRRQGRGRSARGFRVERPEDR